MRWLGVAVLSAWLGLSASAGAEVLIAISKAQQAMTGSKAWHAGLAWLCAAVTR
jgi:hypothetical protein